MQVRVFTIEENKDPVDIALKGIAHAKSNNFNVVIIDTAGRLAIDEQMMEEISQINRAVDPNEALFVVDAMTGQDAVNTAKAFNDVIDYDGVVLKIGRASCRGRGEGGDMEGG